MPYCLVSAFSADFSAPRMRFDSWRAQKPCVSVIRREQKREEHAQLFE